MTKKRIPQLMLIIAVALVLVGSVFANMFNTSVYTVDVSRIAFDTERGTLSGLLYMPKGASQDDPRPTVIVTHGYLNSAEMQDANAIELSRRGMVVLALDMYDHGHSASNADKTGGFLSFWPTAMLDAANYMYQQPYVLKDEAGNGVIGVTGHSMGGFSSSMALFYDEQAFAVNGYRTILCSLTEGSDYSYTAWLGLNINTAVGMFGGRTVGKVAAQYDEFFFNADGASGGTVVKKDYVSTTEGKTFLEQEAPLANTWYDAADGGKRIIYQPAETHPWNHLSTTTTAYAVEFYAEAFAPYAASLKQIDSGNQLWLLKEIFELVALAGLCLLVVPLVGLLLRLPFFRLAKTAAVPTLQPTTDVSSRIGRIALLACCILLPGILFPALMDKNFKSEPLMYLCDAGAIFAVIGALTIILGARDPKFGKKYLGAGVVTVLAGVALVCLTTIKTFPDGKAWQAPTVNQIVYWTLVCAAIATLFMALVFIIGKARQGATLAHYGVKAPPVAILASLATAVVTVVAVYAVVFLADIALKTDFRFWVFAFKTFEAPILPAALKYLPFFFLYYLVGTVAICVNTNSEKVQGGRGKGYLLAILLNAGGITVYLLRQYLTLFITGTAAHPTQALSSILLFAMVPTLVIAACFSRALYKRTGNVWTPAFLNAILMTLMTVANTCVYYQR